MKHIHIGLLHLHCHPFSSLNCFLLSHFWSPVKEDLASWETIIRRQIDSSSQLKSQLSADVVCPGDGEAVSPSCSNSLSLTICNVVITRCQHIPPPPVSEHQRPTAFASSALLGLMWFDLISFCPLLWSINCLLVSALQMERCTRWGVWERTPRRRRWSGCTRPRRTNGSRWRPCPRRGTEPRPSS